MTDYWISGSKYWCEDCKKFISDNKSSRKHHESGATHLENRRKRIADMRHQDIERKKEDNEVDREIQRIKREAVRQHHQDLMTLNKLPSSAAEYSTYQPHESPYGYGNTDTLINYQPGAHAAQPNEMANDDWKYFDEEMIEAQRKRLYGDAYVPSNTDKRKNDAASAAPYVRRRAPISNIQNTDGEGEEDQIQPQETGDEKKENEEEYDPDVQPEVQEEEEKPKKREVNNLIITRATAGIPGYYREVDPSVLYNEYYRLADDEDPTEEQPESTSENINSKKRKDRLSDDDEDRGWEGLSATKERAPEKSLSDQIEQEQGQTVVWKKPKVGANKRGRRNK